MFIARSVWKLTIALVLPLGVAQGQAETIQVVIDKLVFAPAAITAKVGDTIEWINQDAIVHTVTVKGAWEVMIPAKNTVIHRLDKPEAVDFYCRFHPNMTGRLKVEH
jgi:plastocyanin